MLGYGCDKGDLDLLAYFRFVASLAKGLNGPCFIACGGFTNPSLNNVSEALIIEKAIELEMDSLVEVIKEERSITTIENIRNSLPIIEGIIHSNLRYEFEITVVCDSIRFLKVWLLSRWIYKYLDVRVNVAGFDFKRSKKEILRQIPATFLEILFYFSSRIERFFRDRRAKKWRIE